MSAGYYRKIYNRFRKQENSTFDRENDSSGVISSSVFDMPPPPSRNKQPKTENIGVSRKRDIKNAVKQHQEAIDSFIATKANLTPVSIGYYRQIWQDFIMFSGSMNPDYVSKFLRWRFKFNRKHTDDEITLEGIALKYESVLGQIFRHQNIKLDIKFNKKINKHPPSGWNVPYYKATITITMLLCKELILIRGQPPRQGGSPRATLDRGEFT